MQLLTRKCVPCEGGVPPMSDEDEETYLEEVPGWDLDRSGEHKIRRDFRFDDFSGAIAFVNKVAAIAEEEGHHPDIHIYYNKVRLEIYTHAIGGLFENDFIIAAKVNEVLES